MPDILIRGMEMPTSCDECPFEVFGDCNGGKVKRIMDVDDYTSARAPRCPLIELPPHGDLIDADSLSDDLIYDAELAERVLDDTTLVGKERDYLQSEKDIKQNCAYYVSRAPVVVPAERSDPDA